MKAEWFTAAELAKLSLPGLPSASTPDGARRVISRQAQKECWQSRERTGRGGGREYHVSSLPDEARKALALRRLQAPAADSAAPVPATIGASLDWRQLKAKTLSQADARLLLLGEVDALMARDGLTKIAAPTLIATGQLQKIERVNLLQGEEVTLDDGTTVTFDGASEFANFQISHDPFQPWVLATTVIMLASLIGSLVIKRRRIWIRLQPSADGSSTVVEMGGLARTDSAGWGGEFDKLHRALLGLPDPDDIDEEAEENIPVLVTSASQ